MNHVNHMSSRLASEACDPGDGEYPLEALPCAHVFHVACLAARGRGLARGGDVSW